MVDLCVDPVSRVLLLRRYYYYGYRDDGFTATRFIAILCNTGTVLPTYRHRSRHLSLHTFAICISSDLSVFFFL